MSKSERKTPDALHPMDVLEGVLFYNVMQPWMTGIDEDALEKAREFCDEVVDKKG